MIERTENIELVRPLFEEYMWHMKSYFEISDVSAWLVRANEYFKLYKTDSARKIYTISGESGAFGFALVNQEYRYNTTGNVIAEFYITPEKQGNGNGSLLAEHVFSRNLGMWELCVTSENKDGVVFWNKVISSYTNNKYKNRCIDSYNGAVFSFSTA